MEQLEIRDERKGLGFFCDKKWKKMLTIAAHAIGQEAATVATVFNNAISLTGIILTKLDGDALLCDGTRVAIKMVGTGERRAGLKLFRPKRTDQHTRYGGRCFSGRKSTAAGG
jgi:signal recognition particle GTPase